MTVQPTWTSRETIGAAFWKLVSATPGFSLSNMSRKFRHWDQVNGVGQLPFLTNLKTGEQRIRQENGTPAIKFFYHVFVYTMAGDQVATPETSMNDLLDALDAAVQARGSDVMENRQTLGGLVWYCNPLGRAFVDCGDVDGKGVAMVPFEILTPWLT